MVKPRLVQNVGLPTVVGETLRDVHILLYEIDDFAQVVVYLRVGTLLTRGRYSAARLKILFTHENLLGPFLWF